MEIFFLLSLQVFVLLSSGSPQMYMCTSPTETISESHFHQSQMPNIPLRRVVRRSKDEAEENRSSISHTEDNGDELNDVRAVATVPNGLRPETKYKISFGQAVILAQEEAQCLDQFGNQMNKTDPSVTNKVALAQRVITPFGCFQPNTSTQCEQCKNITAQPFLTVKECQHSFCVTLDEICNRTCLKVQKALENVHTFDEDLKIVSHLISYGRDDIPGPRNNKTKQSNKNGISAHDAVMAMKEKDSVIQSVEVFCEGLGDDTIIAKNGFLNGTHFVILKWTINESLAQYLIDTTNENMILKNRKDNETTAPGFVDSNESPELNSLMDGNERRKQRALIYVIEQQSGNSEEWITVGKTPYGLQKVNVLYHSVVYKWRITAVGPNGILDFAVTEHYKTLDGYKTPGPPQRIYVVEQKVKIVEENVKNSTVEVLIGWEPPAEKSCFYKVVLNKPGKLKSDTLRIKNPLGLHMSWFTNLTYGTKYNVRITSRGPTWRWESRHLDFDFSTPSCLESFNYRFDKCEPPPPSDVKADTILIGEDQSIDQQFQVTLTWVPPLNTSEENPIENYIVEIKGGTTSLVDISTMLQKSIIPKEIGPLISNISSYNYSVPGNTTKLLLTNLKPDTEYIVMITSNSTGGRSPKAAQLHFNTCVNAELSQEAVGNWIYVTITFIIAAILLILCNAIRIYIQKRNVKIARTKYFQSMEERDEMGADWSIVPLTEDSFNLKLFDENFPKEKWEIAWDNLTMGEVIGQGAFGVVRRAKMPKCKLEYKLKFRGEDEAWFKSADRIVDDADPEMEMVAVKMVKVSSTRDDREQLIKEITMMQSLGFQSQIVGLLGACTKGRNLCLVLEYCPGGDLLTFVRKVRAKYWPTLGLSGPQMRNSPIPLKRNGITAGMKFCGQTTNSGSGGHRSSVSSTSANRKSFDSSPINYADIGGFSASCSSPENSSPGFQEGENSKKDFEAGLSGMSENTSIPPFFRSQQGFEDDDEFRPIDEKDVLSYARQIAMGMEYLEKNRVVHRDLACRNVLLMGDYKHVKISDFGLSRDIYTWNVYHQKSDGKLPIKWMAIESIFTHVFTTKSDVWSYGILLWELVTLGGTPYPGLGNTELFHLLKSGYRMERPDNCSEELYAVMKKCWRTAAACRPSFTELRRHVETMMEAAEPNLYLSLMADIPADYFQLSSRSDIPLVGKEDGNSTLIKDSVEGKSLTSLVSSRHNRSNSRGSETTNVAYNGSDYAGSSKKSSEVNLSSARRKSQSLYRNTSFSHHQEGSELDSTKSGNNNSQLQERSVHDVDESRFPFQGQTGYDSTKNRKSLGSLNSPMLTNNPFHLSSSCSVISDMNASRNELTNRVDEVDENIAVTENLFSPQTNHSFVLTRQNSATSSSSSYSAKLITKRAPQRVLSVHGQKLEQKNKSGKQEGVDIERRHSLQSPDSGILMQKAGEIGNTCDWEQTSLTGELENVFEEEDEDSQIANMKTLETVCSPSAPYKNLVDWRETAQFSVTTANPVNSLSRLPSRSNSFYQEGSHNKNNPTDQQYPCTQQAQKRPKFTLPFVNVNDMTIIENRTYDLRDT